VTGGTGAEGTGAEGTGIDGMGTPRARCVLAPNPSPMTLDGTNTWILAEPGSARAVVVDPGPAIPGHLHRVQDLLAAAGQTAAQILLTHSHPDHSDGAAAFAAMTGAPVRAADPAFRLGDEGLPPGATITVSGCEIAVVATPGHSADSVCLHLPADQALLTGDTVLGRGTTVIADDGNLTDYLASLDRLRQLTDIAELATLLPGHGPMLSNPAGTLDYYISHRHERIAEVMAALEAGDRTMDEMVARIYHDVDRALWPYAAFSVRAALQYLADQGALPPGVNQ
jgi:glyoxylase-like metal-dependent hydrolase (beta-lactamase superfamily II)